MPLLELDRLSARYDYAPVVQDVSFSVDAGEIVSIFGRNGAGKTTTLRTIMGWLRPSQGRIVFEGEAIGGMSPSETAEFDALIKSLTVRVTILLIEHDIDLVMSLSDHVIVMHQGEKLFEGTPDRVRASPLVREAYLGVDHAAA